MQIGSVIPADGSVRSFAVEPPSQEAVLADLKEAFRLNRLEREYGGYFRQRNGRKFLNDRFWAAWLCGMIGVFYEQWLGVFRLTIAPEGKSDLISSEGLVDVVGVILLMAAMAAPHSFPHHEIRPVRIRELIEMMKRVPKSEAFSRL